jgi:hypothetical protein
VRCGRRPTASAQSAWCRSCQSSSPHSERRGHLVVADDVREQLLALGPATVDRLLRPLRQPHGLSTTKPGRLLKKQIPIRTFTEWTDVKPGFLEGDLVAHCGGMTDGPFLYALTLTDVATTWTECLALLHAFPTPDDDWSTCDRSSVKRGDASRRQSDERGHELELRLGRDMFLFLPGHRDIIITGLEVFFELPDADADHHHDVDLVVGHRQGCEHAERDADEIEIECVASAEWPNLYRGILDVRMGPLGWREHERVGALRFHPAHEHIREIYLVWT